MNLAVVPGIAQLVRCCRHRRERCRQLAVDEAGPLGQLGRDQAARRHVVDQHQQLDVVQGAVGRDAHRDVAGDHRNFGLQVEPPIVVAQLDRVLGSDEPIRCALVHQGVGPEPVGQLGPPRFAHQLHVGDVGGAVEPLEGAGQGRRAIGRIKGQPLDLADGQRPRQRLKRRRQRLPAVEGRLQGRRDAVRRDAPRQVRRHHQEAAVAAVPPTRQFHRAAAATRPRPAASAVSPDRPRPASCRRIRQSPPRRPRRPSPGRRGCRS